MKYVWINIETGQFSNTWSEDVMVNNSASKEELIKDSKGTSWKLIEYSCLSDDAFEFNRLMKIK